MTKLNASLCALAAVLGISAPAAHAQIRNESTHHPERVAGFVTAGSTVVFETSLDEDGKTLYLCARSGLSRMRLNVAGVRP
jgi:hypothetical protein